MSNPTPANNSPTHRAIAHIKEQWIEGKTLKEIAGLYGIDQGNLARAFRRLENCTIKTYVDRMRAEYVKTEVKKANTLGYEIAAALGFSSDFAFYRWVRRVLGMSFKELQRRSRGNVSVPGIPLKRTKNRT